MPFTECQLRRGCTSQAGRVRRTGTRRQRQEHLLLPAQIAIDNTTRDRPSGRSFFVLGLIPPPLNFAKTHARGGRGLQPEQPKDSIPPWGHSGTRRRKTGEKRSELRGLCRVTGHRWEWRQRRGRKGSFSLYKEALFTGRRLCRFRADLPPKPCRFGRVAFSAAQSDECVTPSGAGEKPCRKTKTRYSERSTPHEKPDFRHRD